MPTNEQTNAEPQVALLVSFCDSLYNKFVLYASVQV